MDDYVAFYRDPRSRQSRFIVQGEVDREEISLAVESLIGLLDAIDGDPDLEGECSEDEVSRPPDDGLQNMPTGPGCNISDPDYAVDDRPCDPDSDGDTDERIPGGGSGA